MGKVTDHQALVHTFLALDPDTWTAALAAIGVECVNGVYAEGNGVGSTV